MEKNYLDKNGESLKSGDYVFYSERPQSNYADALYLLKELPDSEELRFFCQVVNVGGRYQSHDDLPENTIDLKWYLKDGRLNDVEKIKAPLTDDLIDYMNQYYPLDKK